MRHPLLRILGIILLLLGMNFSAYYLSMRGSMLELLLIEAVPFYLFLYLISTPDSRLRKILKKPLSEGKQILQRTALLVVVGMIFFLLRRQGASVKVDALPVADHIVGVTIETKWHSQKYAECVYRSSANQKCLSTYGLVGTPTEPKSEKVSFNEWVVTGTVECKNTVETMPPDWDKACD